jgi:glycosyltransferase involved in cell wall biosynthesis
MSKNILIISNDRLLIKKDKVSSDYNDTINIIEGLTEKNKLGFFCRTSNFFKNYLSQKKKYKKFPKLKLFDLINIDNYKIFMISVTPFNFLSLLFIKIWNKNLTGFVYLRSDGYKEYYQKYSIFGYAIYSFMFKVVTSCLQIITVSKNMTGLNKDYYLITPSEIEQKWFLNRKKPRIKKPQLLYLGRYKKEKGVFSLIEIINLIKDHLELKIVGVKNNILSKNKKIKFLKELNSTKKIINCYDSCNIFVLPSYTEGAPKVILESLARHRPVIIFEDIKHVKKNFKGVFICKRDAADFTKKINYILKNYKKIINELKKNRIYTKQDFQNRLNKLIA